MNELFESITAIPGITILCLLMAQGIKSWTPVDNKHLPSLCGALGAILGVVSFLFIPDYLPAGNIIVAASIGAVSGWGATGVNQIKKQYESED
ncbi:MAG: phage holin family protein [Sporomusa sp.]